VSSSLKVRDKSYSLLVGTGGHQLGN